MKLKMSCHGVCTATCSLSLWYYHNPDVKHVYRVVLIGQHKPHRTKIALCALRHHLYYVF